MCTHLVLPSDIATHHLDLSHPLKAETLQMEELEDEGDRAGASSGGEGVGKKG